MQITPDKIEAAINASFAKTYKAFGDFIDSGEIYSLCKTAIYNTRLMNNIIFCNDIHKIPPTNTFLKASGANNMRDLTELEKRSVGAFWGFVFKYVFGYRNQKIVAARVNTVKTASYFYDAPQPTEVIQGGTK